MKFQPGVRADNVAPQIWWAMGKADLLHQQMFGEELTITSLRDHHDDRPQSLHVRDGIGRAFDGRLRERSLEERQAYCMALRVRIDRHGFDTVLHGNHVHSEFDPKPGEVWIGEAPE